MRGDVTKDENINFDGYIDNSILWIYWEISVDMLTQNIGEMKNW